MDWNELDDHAASSGGSGGGFYTFKVGDNNLRLVSLGEHMTRAGFNPGDAPRQRFLFWCIDRDDAVIKEEGGKDKVKLQIVDCGTMIIKALRAYQKEGDYAFPADESPPYDINIKATGEKKQRRYVVMPARKNTPLNTEEVLAIKDLTPLSEIKDRLKAKEEDAKLPPAQASGDIPADTIVNDPVRGKVPVAPPSDEIDIKDIKF